MNSVDSVVLTSKNVFKIENSAFVSLSLFSRHGQRWKGQRKVYLKVMQLFASTTSFVEVIGTLNNTTLSCFFVLIDKRCFSTQRSTPNNIVENCGF